MTDLLKRGQKHMHPFCSVRLKEVSNNRNDHKSQVEAVRVRSSQTSQGSFFSLALTVYLYLNDSTHGTP